MSTQPGEKQAVDREQIRRWKANLETEIDGIAIYRLLAEAEKDPERKAIFEELADVEVHHEQVFREKDTAQVIDWIQIDLTKDTPPARVHLWKDNTPREELPLGKYAKVTAAAPIRANREFWRWVAAAGLGVLLFEWWFYHRRTV